MAKSRTRRSRAKSPAKRLSASSATQPHRVGIRLTPAMKAQLDEVAFEWQTTRANVMRELIAHALKSPPKRKR